MSELHCANCGKPWTAKDGDNGCCWNESLCALITLRRSPPAPAIDVEALAREYLAAHDAFQATDAGSEEDAEPQEWIDASMRYVKASEALRAALGGKEQR